MLSRKEKIMDKYKVRLTFTQPILGTVAKSKEIYEGWVQEAARKAAEAAGITLTEEQLAEELKTVEDIEEKGWTGFHQLDGRPILYDYVLKGFFKDACGMLRRAGGTQSSKIKAYKKIIDGLVFITPRKIPLNINGGEMGTLERPLRASTAQGDRVALARSDTCPVGTTIEFFVSILGQVPEKLLIEWLDYGQLRGLGQWRNAGWGAFEYEIEPVA
jgi:hypothetical protein